MRGNYSETLGQYLKRERQSRSVSLEEVCRATRISLPVLEALERDDFDSIPRKEFIPGFLRGYVRHLGLPRDEVLRRYRIQVELSARKEKFQQMPLFPGTVPPLEQEDGGETRSPAAVPPKKRWNLPWKVLLRIGIVLAALALSFYLHHTLEKGGKGNPVSDPGKPLPEGNRWSG